ncbi:hypothetical protein BaRGS_00027590 [Batillaria attramentaria]|uniref:Uncharacterized protein n=1 Tax=Batillaria attramentaria TaxID=370345 RepID=A0ABD0K309_9CAEN
MICRKSGIKEASMKNCGFFRKGGFLTSGLSGWIYNFVESAMSQNLPYTLEKPRYKRCLKPWLCFHVALHSPTTGDYPTV